MNNLSLSDVLNKHKDSEGHILYFFNNIDNYIQNVVTFITTGLKVDSHIILIENDRNIRLINQLLHKEFNQKEIDKIHLINNFDFYYENKSFDPQRIFYYYKKNILPYLESNNPVWTWGLVEWGEDKEIFQQVIEYEEKLHIFTNQKGIMAVCAYDINRTTDKLKEMLIRCHSVVLTDNP